VVGEDRAELEGKRIERPGHFAGRQHERRREARVVPRRDARRAAAQILVPDRIDDGQRVDERPLAVAVRCVAVCRLMRVNALNDERLHTSAEDLAQVALERLNRGRDVCHMGIINECVSGS
jgi:hypothetical protein